MELRYEERNARPVAGAIGLLIRTAKGLRILRYGPVRYHAGLGIYYCGGGSWPEEIVAEVLRV